MTPARAAAGAVALQALLLGVLLVDSHGDATVLLCFGGDVRLPAGLAEPARFAGTHGYDGEFYALVALDPLDRRGTASFLDDPGKRFSRILLPGLARLLGARDLRGVAARFAFLNLLAAAAVAALVAASRREEKGSSWIGLSAGANVGLAVAVSRGLPGPAGTALVLLGLALRARGRIGAAGASLAIASLDHEIFAVVPVALAVRDLLRGRSRGLLWLLPLLPSLAWRAWLLRRGLRGALPFAEVGPPLLAALWAGGEGARFRGFPPEDLFSLLHLAAFLLIPSTLRRVREEAAPLAALWLAAASAGRDVWVAFWSSSRASAPAFALAAARGGRIGGIASIAAASFTPAMAVWFAFFPPVLSLP